MRILVTFAVKAEFSPWSSRHPFVPYEFEMWEKRRDFDLFKANIGRDEVTVLLTGMGAENAAKAMLSLPVEQYDICISSGLAGALDAGIEPQEVIVARTAETMDQSLRGVADASLVELATYTGASPVNISLTSGKVIATAEEKESLSQKGSIVEMESAHILAAAGRHHLPAVVIRGISDAADEDMPVDFARILDSRGHLKMGGLLKEVGLSPYRIPLLIQFGRQSRAAANSLADFLDRYVAAISENWTRTAHPKIEEVPAT
jgi:adenosylhomocysteine nucleosidase